MCFANKLREVRKEKGFTQKSLAKEVGIDQSRVSAYEAGEDIPNDIIINIIKVLNSPRLTLEYASKMHSEVVNIPTLNNVNEDVVNVLDVVMEEAEEMIAAGRRLKKIIRNKRTRSDFEESELEEVLELEEQIADLIPCLRLHFITMSENFDFDIAKLEKRMEMKLREKNLLI